jgi:hypothetical protein
LQLKEPDCVLRLSHDTTENRRLLRVHEARCPARAVHHMERAYEAAKILHRRFAKFRHL